LVGKKNKWLRIGKIKKKTIQLRRNKRKNENKKGFVGVGVGKIKTKERRQRRDVCRRNRAEEGTPILGSQPGIVNTHPRIESE
jgi:hypothetical protein